MNVTKTVTYDVKFQVAYFLRTEGGMESDYFGKPVDTLPLALEQLELAQAHDPNQDWIIILETTKVVK